MAKVNSIESSSEEALTRKYKREKNGICLEKQWYLQSRSGADVTSDAGINIQEAWKFTRGNPQIVVAVLDASFDLEHPAFSRPGKIICPKDYVDQNRPFQSIHLIPHGSCCAGLAVGESDEHEITGVAPACSFMPIRIPLHASDELLIQILEEISSAADIISCSWSFPPINAPISSALSECITKITLQGGPRKNGCVICFAASNYNAPMCDLQNKEFRWLDEGLDQLVITEGPIQNGLAAHPDVITVASSTSLNKKALYSNWGREISICAPSNNYHPFNRYFEVEGRRDIWTTGNSRHKQLLYTDQFGGTSAATALVAGVAALLRSVNPELSAEEVKMILQDTADKIEDDEIDYLGYNRGEYIDGHSAWFGHGKVNAGRAVREARRIMEKKLNARV